VRGAQPFDPADFADLTSGADFFLVTAFGQIDKQPGLGEILASLRVAARGDGYVLYALPQ
jgi:hypothetical protein